MVQPGRKQGRCVDSSYQCGRHTPGGIYAEIPERLDGDGTSENFGDARKIEVPEEYRKESLVYLPLKYGLVTYKELADGTLTMSQFWKAKKQAKFMEWLEDKQHSVSNNKNEVEYFD